MINFYKFFVDPPLDKLLPDMIPPPPGYMLPKTLVLDLKGTIVHTSYALGKGYEVMKRPGLDDFLRKMSQLYEVIIFSDEETMFTQQIAESLDPKHRIFNGRLGRESLCYRKGEFIKDLSYLNRDLKNIVVIEKSPKRVAYHAENVVVLPEFQGNSDDKFLIELIPFLEHLVKDQVRDVREEIKKFGQADTGKKYINHLQSMQSKLNMQRQKGVGGLFQKMHQASQKTNQKETSDSQPADMSESPKPPSAN